MSELKHRWIGKIRKLIYNYVFKRVVAWHDGRIVDQELVDALYWYDIYYHPEDSKHNLTLQQKD